MCIPLKDNKKPKKKSPKKETTKKTQKDHKSHQTSGTKTPAKSSNGFLRGAPIVVDVGPATNAIFCYTVQALEVDHLRWLACAGGRPQVRSV